MIRKKGLDKNVKKRKCKRERSKIVEDTHKRSNVLLQKRVPTHGGLSGKSGHRLLLILIVSFKKFLR